MSVRLYKGTPPLALIAISSFFPPHSPAPRRRYPCTSLLARGDVVVAGFVTGHIRIYRAGAAAAASGMEVEVAAHSRAVTALDWHPAQFTVSGGAGWARIAGNGGAAYCGMHVQVRGLCAARSAATLALSPP